MLCEDLHNLHLLFVDMLSHLQGGKGVLVDTVQTISVPDCAVDLLCDPQCVACSHSVL